MHGLVNQAIKDLVVTEHDLATWDKIAIEANITSDDFMTHHSYDDELTYKLIGAAEKVLGVDAELIMIEFGKFWILHTGKKKYGELMASGGQNLKEFLRHLPNFHSRIMLMFPDIKPPEFVVEEIDNDRVHITYLTYRMGLTPFFEGLMYGLSEMFNEPIGLKKLSTIEHGAKYEITWS